VKEQFGLGDIQALIIDIDGTLLRGPLPMPGLFELFAFLRSRQVSFVVVSNNATKTPTQYRTKLADLGVEVEVENILTAATATAAYLRRELRQDAALYIIGERALEEVFRRAGFALLGDASQLAEAVVVGGDSTLTYDKLKHAVLLLQRGARLVGTNPDLLCPTEEGLVPEAGTTLAALQAATGVAPTVVGKPARYLFDVAMERMGSTPARTAVLGDRLETDILGGQGAGLKTVLVTTGVDNERTMRQKGIEPDLVVSGLHELIEIWEKQSKHLNHEEAADDNP
jgi:4-nitrophenyl phosphatase